MLRWLTAGESHGPALVAILEGLPALTEVTTSDVAHDLARRRLGTGRGARMKFEQDAVRIVGGVRHGRTMGGPVAIEVGNTEWPKWEQVMAADPVDPVVLAELARNAPLTRPRPGHADLAGMQKYGFSDARPVLERASARETAARVALGAVARAFLRQVGEIEVLSHVVRIGTVTAPDGLVPEPETWRESTSTRFAAWTRPHRPPWWPRSRQPIGTATPSAGSWRWWPTTCHRDWAATSTGIVAWTRGWPPR